MSLCEIRHRAHVVVAAAIVLTLTSSLGMGAVAHDIGSADINAFPWSSVSKIYNGARSSCTGSVIAGDKALTAAHCLYNPVTRRFLQASSLHLLLGYENGEYRAHLRVAGYVVSPQYKPGNGKTSLLQDWALLILAETVPNNTTPIPLAKRRASAGDAIMIGGFSKQHPFKLTADTDCRIQGVMQDGMLVHDCSVLPGDSGAPVLTRAGNNAEIIGIQVASAQGAASSVGLALPVTSIAQIVTLPQTELRGMQSGGDHQR